MAYVLDGSVKRGQRRKWVIWQSKPRENARASGEVVRGRERRELSFFSTDLRFSVSSRVPLARLLSTISSKGRDCSQAKSEFKNISRGCWFYTRFDFNKVYFCDQPKPAELLDKDWSFAFGLGWNDILTGMAGWHNGFSEEPRIDERIVGASGKVWKVFRA